MATYRYFKLNCTASVSAFAFMINEIELYETPSNVRSGDITTSGMTVTDNQNYGAGYEGSKVFNNSFSLGAGNRWQMNGQSYPIWVKIDLGSGNEKEVLSYSVMADDGSYPPKDWTLQGSDDDSSWTTISTVTDQTGWGTGETRIYAVDNLFTLSGTVKDMGGSGIVRDIRVVHRATGALIGDTVSTSGTGAWSKGVPTEGPYQIIEFKSSAVDEEALIYDGVTAV